MTLTTLIDEQIAYPGGWGHVACSAPIEPFQCLLPEIDYASGYQQIHLKGGMHNPWGVVGFDKAISILKDPTNFPSRRSLSKEGEESQSTVKSALFNLSNKSLIFLDGEPHRDLRKLFLFDFGATEVQKIESMIRECARAVISRVPSHDVLDLSEAFCRPFTIQVISRMLGIPEDKNEKYATWSTAAFRGIDLSGDRRLFIAGETAAREWMQDVMNLQFEPASSSSSGVAARFKQVALELGMDQEDIAVAVGFLYLAGHSTTSSSLASAIRSVLNSNILKERVVQEEIHWGSFIGEVTRFFPPAQVVRRTVADPTRCDNRAKEGDPLYIIIGAACRDPKVFKDPDVFDPDRFPEKRFIFPFGVGTHHCIGSYLAPMILKVGLQELLNAYPSMKWEKGELPAYARLFSVLDYDKFPVRMGPRSPLFT